MNAEQLNAIKERAEKATSGPWKYGKSSGIYSVGAKDSVARGDGQSDIIIQETDAEFLAHAREDIPALVAEVERLQNEVKAMFHAGYADGKRDARRIRELIAND